MAVASYNFLASSELSLFRPRTESRLRRRLRDRRLSSFLLLRIFSSFVLQREVFKHFDEDSRPREDKIIHNKLTKPRRENISQQGHKGRKDGPFEFLKSVFVASWPT
jgi:hypothetical protein